MPINKDNAAAFLPFLQALADGEDVYHQNPNTGVWYKPKGGFVFDADPETYSIGKPEDDDANDAGPDADGEAVFKAVLKSREDGSLKISERNFYSEDEALEFRFKKYDIVKVFQVR